MTNRIDVFARTFNRKPGAGRVYETLVPVPADTSLEGLLQAAYAAGVRRGGAGRNYGGVFEIQTDAGVWDTKDGGKLTPSTAVFKTWQELEEEEKAEAA